MQEVALGYEQRRSEPATFAACVATVLEVPLSAVPLPRPGEGPTSSWLMSRWLGGMGLGLVPVAAPATFAWAGPWIARVVPASGGEARFVVMYGVPSGVAWDPSGATEEDWTIVDGFLIAPGDIALARPPQAAPAATRGRVEEIWVASAAGETAERLDRVVALAGKGLQGDRHVLGTGTFPSGLPGSALTLIQAEVCESFSPPLVANEHRRNIVTRGIELNALVGYDFRIGELRCRGMRLCEPCKVVSRYAGRPVLRPLVHRGGLRADILEDGVISAGDEIAAAPGQPA
ncbi:MAG TPA: MOSC domain-containing protein [Acidimicrobiales bacterium]|nr:MOSC domain-containing protein [Acidimicrobiales bacterium]